MPYKRGGFKDQELMSARKRRRGSRGSSKAASRGFSIPQMAYEEKKFLDSSATLSASVAGAASLHLNAIPAGTGISERIGNHTQIKKIMMRGFLDQSGTSSATTENQKVVILIVYDKQTNKSTQAITDILEGGNDVNSYNKLENRDRFTVLKRVEYVFGAHSSSEPVGPSIALVDEYIDVDLPTHYDGTNGTIGEITTGSVFCFVLSSAAGVTSNLAATLNFRVRYEG